MIVCVPYFGDKDGAYRPLLTRWLYEYRLSGSPWPILILSDLDGPKIEQPTLRVNISGYADVIRPGQPFDTKGAIVCRVLLEREGYDLLIVDADAFVQHDPAPLLADAWGRPIAMPRDLGAVGFQCPILPRPFDHVCKRSAGVMWFGKDGSRSQIVAEYLRNWKRLLPLHQRDGRVLGVSEPARLLEQHSWTLVAHDLNVPMLPDELNWHRHTAGPNPKAAIYHFCGSGKFLGHVQPATQAISPRELVPA